MPPFVMGTTMPSVLIPNTFPAFSAPCATSTLLLIAQDVEQVIYPYALIYICG